MLDTGNAVMVCKAFIQKRVSGGDELCHRPVLLDDVVYEKLSLALQRVAKRFVVMQAEGLRRAKKGETAQLEPLARKIRRHRPRPRIVQHPPNLPFDLGMQPTLLRYRQQRFIWNTAPEKK